MGIDQPAKALIGKCVKIKVTSTHKWHISGHIIDANPKPVEVGADYFEKLDFQRKEKLRKQLQDDLALQKQRELVLNKPKIEVDSGKNNELYMHLAGMSFIALGVFSLLRQLF